MAGWLVANATACAGLLILGAVLGGLGVWLQQRRSVRLAERYQRRLVRFKRAVRQEVAQMVDENALTAAFQRRLAKKDARTQSGVERCLEGPKPAAENKTVVLQSAEILAVRGDEG